MNWKIIQTIIRRDLRVVLRSRAVVLPMVIVSLVMTVGIPLLMAAIVLNVDLSAPEMADMQVILNQMPPAFLADYGHLPYEYQAFLFMVMYTFAPLFLILPLMTASVIAADSFAGEKERKTLEALLYTPTSDRELYIGKTLAPWVMALAVTLIGLAGYALIVNGVAMGEVGYIFFPNLLWIIITLWVAPAAAGLGLGAMVLVSARVNTFQDAYQLGSMAVLPVVLLLLGQLAGVIALGEGLALAIGAALWAIDAVLLWYGARSFNRGRLLSRL